MSNEEMNKVDVTLWGWWSEESMMILSDFSEALTDIDTRQPAALIHDSVMAEAAEDPDIAAKNYEYFNSIQFDVDMNELASELKTELQDA